jgi:uncharacterized protein YuzE
MGNAMTTPSIEPVMELQVRYYQDTDTLVLATGQPGPNGETVGRDLVAFTNAEGDVVGVTLEHAAKTLLPYLLDSLSNATCPEVATRSIP